MHAGVTGRRQLRSLPLQQRPHVSPAVLSIPDLEIGPSGATPGVWPPGAVMQRWLDSEGRLVATGGRLRGRWWMHWRGLATFWFSEAGAVHAEAARGAGERDLRDIYVRGVVPVVMLARGFEGLHAGAIMEPAGVVGLCANSGTGKSTISLALAASGAGHFADDTLMYRIEAGRASAYRLPFPVRVDAAARVALGEGASLAAAPPALPAEAPIHRIYHLVRDAKLEPGRPEFVDVPPSRRFEVLLTHAHPFDLGDEDRRRSFIESLMTLARTVDVCECRFAPDLAALRLLAESIRGHAAKV